MTPGFCPFMTNAAGKLAPCLATCALNVDGVCSFRRLAMDSAPVDDPRRRILVDLLYAYLMSARR